MIRRPTLAMLLASTVLAHGAASAAPPAASGQAPAFGQYTPALEFNATVVASEYLTMRDGVRIAVSVTRPAVDGKPVEGRFPVIWTASLDIKGPNSDGGPIDARGGRFGMGRIVGHGYVVVTAARRGAGASFGRRRGYHDRNEAYDAYEITEWAARQPWSSGKVGMFGCSNTGEAVLHAMTVLPPSLTAVFTGCFSWNKFDGMTRGGIIANWGTGPTRTIEQDMRATPVDGDEDRKLLRAAAEEHQGSTDLFELMVGMPHRDSHSTLTQSRFWGEGSASSYVSQLSTSRVAIYIQGGWYDDFRREGLVAMSNLPNRPKIIIGPWTHCATTGFDEGVAAEALRFFDQRLKGIDTGILRDPPIHYYTINAPGGTAWRSADRWPLPATEMRTYYLSGAANGSALAERSGRRATETAFTVHREGQCPGEGGAMAQPCHIPGAGASWSTPVAADTEITGHPLVDLWIVSDAPDEHVFAYLEEVAPDGKVTIVTEGRLKASLRSVNDAPWQQYDLPWHRSHREDAQPLEIAVPARLQFDMLPASYVFRKGHRLQITVTGWDPRERRAPAELSRIRILDAPQYRSTVMLPYPQRPK